MMCMQYWIINPGPCLELWGCGCILWQPASTPYPYGMGTWGVVTTRPFLFVLLLFCLLAPNLPLTCSRRAEL